MTSEEFIRLDTERLSALSSEQLANMMGNPDLSAYKDKAETTDFSDFFLHPWTTKAILDPLITDLSSIKFLNLDLATVQMVEHSVVWSILNQLNTYISFT